MFISMIVPKIYGVDIELFLGILIVVYLVLFERIKIKSIHFYMMLPLFILVVISGINTIVLEERYAFFALIRVVLYLVITLIILDSTPIKTLWRYSCVFICINILIIYLEYLNIPFFKDLIRTVHEFFYTTRTVDYRAKGLFPGYASAGLFMGVSSIFILIGLKLNVIKGEKYLLLAMFSFFATIFTSRTGMIVSLIGIIILMFINKKENVKKIKIKKLFSYVLLTVFSVFLIKSIFELVNPEMFKITLLRTFEFYYSYKNGSGITTNSTEELVNTYSIPNDIHTFFIGNNKEPWITNGIQSDAGIIQTLYQYGVLGTLLFYLPVAIAVIYCLYINKKKSFSLLMLTMLLAFSEFKGGYIYSKFIFILYLIIFVTLINSKQKEIEGNKNVEID